MAYKKSKIPDVRRVLRRFHAVAVNLTYQGVHDYADLSRDGFKKRIEDQGFSSFIRRPLSPKYLAWKIKNRLDHRVMIRTSHYKDSIKTMVRSAPANPNARTYCVGFAESDMAVDHEGNTIDLPLNTLSAIHEYGSHANNIPPRPHWRPYYRNMAGEAPGVRLAIRKRIMKRMKVLFPGAA